MKEIKKNYISIFFIFAIIFCIALVGYKTFKNHRQTMGQGDVVINTDFGLFLATQHALYINDFDNAATMINEVKADHKIVKQAKNIADFFDGKMPENAGTLKDSKDLIDDMVYTAFLIQKDDWKGVYNRHGKDESVLSAPLRIFPAVKLGKTKEALKYIDSIPTTDSWKSFVRGQIAVLNNDIDGAAKEFAKVHPNFMNVNDYLYLMSFYKHHNMPEDMEILKEDFLAGLGGMYMVEYSDIPDWENYSGYKNNLVFSIIQTISHSQFMMYTDLSLMFLRFSQIISDKSNTDAINYYLGLYYFNNYGDYETCFNKIKSSNPLYLFGQLKMAQKNNNRKAIQQMANKNPLFIPALFDAVHDNIRKGDKRAALSLINRGLRKKDLPDIGRVYLLKQRAHVHLMFNSPNAAQKDINEFKKLDDLKTSDFLILQARVWEQQGKNLDKAYDYLMTLIKINPSDVNAWDILGLIVNKTEGVENALEILEHIGETSSNISSIYEHLGDLYVEQGDKERAIRAYKHALDLSDDCLIVVPHVQKKIRKIK